MSHPTEPSGITASDPTLREASSLEEAARADRARRMDMILAAHALAEGAAIVTSNVKHPEHCMTTHPRSATVP